MRSGETALMIGNANGTDDHLMAAAALKLASGGWNVIVQRISSDTFGTTDSDSTLKTLQRSARLIQLAQNSTEIIPSIGIEESFEPYLDVLSQFVDK